MKDSRVVPRKSRKRISLIILSIGSLLLSTCSQTKTLEVSAIDKIAQQGKPMIRIGDKIIYEGHFQLAQEVFPGFRQGFADPEGRKKLIEDIITQELFLQKAQEEKRFQKDQELQKKIWFQNRSLTGGSILVTALEERTQKEYEKQKEKLFTQVKIGDIVLLYENQTGSTLEEKKQAALQKAQEIQEKLNSKNFLQLASDLSEDPVVRGSGGELGPVSWLDQRLKTLGWEPLIQQAFELKVGEISPPIPTQEGVHLIQVLEEKQVQPYAKVAPLLRNQLVEPVRKDLLQELLANTKIEYLEPGLQSLEYFSSLKTQERLQK